MNHDKLVLLLNRLLGQHKHKEQEYRFYCPFCNHYKRKLYVNVETQRWHCWVCGKAGLKISSLILKISKNRNDIDEYNKIKRSSSSFTPDIRVTTRIEQAESIQLPNQFISLLYKKQSFLLQRAKNYLYARGITAQHIHMFNIGVCLDGKFKDRIIIPSYDNQFKLNYFIARSITSNPRLKYLNPDKGKNIIPLQSNINWKFPVVLVQGMFDAITLKYNTIPLFGKTISRDNNHLITTMLRRKCKVVVFLDADARSDMFKLCQTLYNHGILNIYYVDMLGLQNKDANELGFYKSWQLIANAKKYEPNTSLSDSIKSKIGKIHDKKNITHFRSSYSSI